MEHACVYVSERTRNVQTKTIDSNEACEGMNFPYAIMQLAPGVVYFGAL